MTTFPSWTHTHTHTHTLYGLGHTAYRKLTHTLFLNANLHHHPENKDYVLSTLAYKAMAICTKECAMKTSMFKQNGLNNRSFVLST